MFHWNVKVPLVEEFEFLWFMQEVLLLKLFWQDIRIEIPKIDEQP